MKTGLICLFNFTVGICFGIHYYIVIITNNSINFQGQSHTSFYHFWPTDIRYGCEKSRETVPFKGTLMAGMPSPTLNSRKFSPSSSSDRASASSRPEQNLTQEQTESGKIEELTELGKMERRTNRVMKNGRTNKE